MFQRIRESRREAGEGGFTLIELLVVIIILGILAAVVVFAVGGVGDKGQSASCKIDTRTIRTAQEAHLAKTGTYATTTDALRLGGFLSETSKYHQIANVVQPSSSTPGSFDIILLADKSDGTSSCGTAGAVAGTTGNF